MKGNKLEVFTQCKNCGEQIPEQRQKRHAKFCSYDCQRKFYFNTGLADVIKIPTSTTGALHELVVCAELMKLGFYVFRAQSPSSPCDVIALKNNKAYKIEVTTGYRAGNKIGFPNKGETYDFDYLAAVLYDKSIFWFDKNRTLTDFPLNLI
jgi:endogenous inhibitor of DNA gyrase (YacG/DUF329 family)